MNLLVLTQKVNADDAILGFFVEWLDRLARRVDRLRVIALEKGPFELPGNVEVFSLGKERGAGSAAMLLRFNRALWRVCRRERPHAILAHMVPRYVLYALPVARLHRIPLDLWYTHKGVDRTLRMAHPFLRRVFTASEESFRLPSNKKVVTGHGIDTEFFKPDEGAPGKGIVTVGRITPSKDQEVVVRALALLKEQRGGDEITTRIVGEPLLPSDRQYLERVKGIAAGSGLEDLLHFEGAVPHRRMSECYASARIMVNASHTGSVDKVVLEAMATGVLPLTCNESFVPLLGDLAERLVFRKGDAEDLAARITALLDLADPERAHMAAALRRIVVDHHNLDDLVDKIISMMKN